MATDQTIGHIVRAIILVIAMAMDIDIIDGDMYVTGLIIEVVQYGITVATGLTGRVGGNDMIVTCPIGNKHISDGDFFNL